MTTRDAIRAEAMSWLGTPYHHLGDVKGVGTDCAMILVRIYSSLGLIPRTTDPRPYAPDWHLHRGEERYLGWLEQFGHHVETPRVGDVAVWRFGRTYSHGAVVVDEGGTIVHAYRDAGCVTLGNLSETQLRGREHRYYQLNGVKD